LSYVVLVNTFTRHCPVRLQPSTMTTERWSWIM